MAKRVYLSYGAEDRWARDMVVEAAERAGYEVKWDEEVEKRPEDEDWQAEVREKIRGADGVAVLVGNRPMEAEDMRWEVRCVELDGVPARAFYATKQERPDMLPGELTGWLIQTGNWDHVRAWLDTL